MQRVAGMDKILCHLDRGLVHHLHAGRNDARGDDRPDRVGGAAVGGKADQGGTLGLRLGQQAHGHFGNDSQQTLRTDQQPHHVQARLVVAAAEADHVAVQRDEFDGEDIVAGHAVFQAMHAAGIFRDIAADRTGDLAGGVGGVIEAVGIDRAADGQICHTRLDAGLAVGQIDLEDAVEAAHGQHDSVRDGKRSARERRAAAAWNHADAQVPAQSQDSRDLVHGLGQYRGQRALAIGRKRVAVIGGQTLVVDNHALAGHNPPQAFDQLTSSSDHLAVRIRHPHRVTSLVRRFRTHIFSSLYPEKPKGRNGDPDPLDRRPQDRQEPA